MAKRDRKARRDANRLGNDVQRLTLANDAAKREIDTLDVALGTGRDLLVEITKAITVAQRHPNVESKVLCVDIVQMFEAHMVLAGKACKALGLHLNENEHVYELSNGSAVSVNLKVPS